MAFHGPAYGLSAELKQKQEAKYDPQLEREARQWIEAATGMSIGSDFHAGLKNGVILCTLANKIQPGIIPKINRNNMPFMQMENIGYFLTAIGQMGVPPNESFMTVDLFEAKNMGQVVLAVHSLGRVAKQKGFRPQLNSSVKSSNALPSDWHGGPSTTATVAVNTSARSSSPPSSSSPSSSPSFASSPQRNTGGGYRPATTTTTTTTSTSSSSSTATTGSGFPFGTKFNPYTGEPISKFDPFTGKQNW
ncbi:Calponin-2 [Balamuthia mandrillaris]